MASLTRQQVLDQTHGGLDIILAYYPQAAGCAGQKGKFFRRRADERTPSANLRQYGGGEWKVTDFGDEATARTCFDIVMDEESCRFDEAMAIIQTRFGIKGSEGKGSAAGAFISRRDARADEAEGTTLTTINDNFSADELKVLGPRVTADTVASLHWFSVKRKTTVKDRKATDVDSTASYPIFARQCMLDTADANGNTCFYKVYEPLAADKQWRFSYLPAGVKPQRYTNGLWELRRAWERFNEKDRTAWESDPSNEGKPYRDKKLPEAIICSGERDALSARALGYWPLWFNSETYDPTVEEMREIYRYVEVVYNIPDIDETGRRRGSKLALRFLDIRTAWLPSWLRTFRDWRGHARKDLRDFVEVRPEAQSFRDLLTLAMPARFWEEGWSERLKKPVYEINTSYLHYFLTLNGFYTLKDDDSDSVEYIRIEGATVRRIKAKDIQAFLKQFTIDRALPVGIRNLVLNSPRTSDSSLCQLDEIAPDFTDYSPTEQYMFFRNCTWRITKDGIETYKGELPGGRCVWDRNIVDHPVRLYKDDEVPFRASCHRDPLGSLRFTLDVVPVAARRADGTQQSLPPKSKLFCYLLNTSRLYWRKELEQAWQDGAQRVWRIESAECDAATYAERYKFCVDGPLLSDDEVQEQKLNLLNKLYAIGYVLHRFKSPSRAWALYAMDNKIGDEDQCNGRSGKSFLLKALGQFMQTVNLSGRNPKLLDNPHVFDQVTKHTDFVLVDDCDKYLPVSQFYDAITSGMTVNPKNNRSYYIEFEDSPKFGFTTNYVPRDFDPSTNARLLYMVFSDYYHEATEDNDYLESRSIYDDFSQNLMTATDYTDEDWNADINFLALCLRFYLDCADAGLKIQPPMGNIIQRKLKADMGALFEDWAQQYFTPEDGAANLNCCIARDALYDDFISFSKASKTFWTMQRFTKSLKSFAELSPVIADLNPASMRNASGRIQRKVDGVVKDMVYMLAAPGVQCVNMPPESEEAKLLTENTDELPY